MCCKEWLLAKRRILKKKQIDQATTEGSEVSRNTLLGCSALFQFQFVHHNAPVKISISLLIQMYNYLAAFAGSAEV